MGDGIRARDMMVRRVFTVKPDDLVHDAVRWLLKKRFSGAPVVGADKKVIGVLSEKDCVQALMRAVQERMPPARVKDVMSTDLITVEPQTDILTVSHLFLTNPIRRLPVLDEKGRLVGQISRRDLLQAAVKVFDSADSRESAALYLSATGQERPASMRNGTPKFAPGRNKKPS